MDQLSKLQSQAQEWFQLYIDTFAQVLTDARVLVHKLDQLVDEQLDSELGQNLAIALIIATPIFGVWLFFGVLI